MPHRKKKRQPISVDYDRSSDVLYVAIEPIAPAEGEDRPRGVVLRYTMDGDIPCGVTVIGYRLNRWAENPAQLAELVADHLGLHPLTVLGEIERATREH